MNLYIGIWDDGVDPCFTLSCQGTNTLDTIHAMEKTIHTFPNRLLVIAVDEKGHPYVADDYNVSEDGELS